MRLSLCMATFNEESFIHYPLDSAYDFADEVIIVDGSSTDDTVKKAKSYGSKVKVFVEDNPPMFHINKQKAIERASGDWILQLDADEALSPGLKDEIQEVITGGRARGPDRAEVSSTVGKSEGRPRNYVAFWIPRKNYFLGRFLTKGGVYPDYTIRLYKKGVAHFPCKSVHENVEITPPVILSKAKDPSVYIGHLKNDLLHYADPTFNRYLNRWKRYTTLDAKLLIEDGKKPGLFSYTVLKPLAWFVNAYGRHKGFLDGWQGFVFAFFSSIRFLRIYTEYWKLKKS